MELTNEQVELLGRSIANALYKKIEVSLTYRTGHRNAIEHLVHILGKNIGENQKIIIKEK